MKVLTFIPALVLAITPLGCDLLTGNDGPLPFKWVADGNQLIFDFHPVSDTLVRPNGFRYDDTSDALVMNVISDGKTFSFWVEFPWEFMIQELDPGIRDLSGKRTHEGLEEYDLASCDDILGLSRFYYVRVPARPDEGQAFPLYTCDKEITENLRIEATNEVINVPAGDFTVFVIRSLERRRLEYWSETDGLIKIELFEPDGDLLGYYELVERNFSSRTQP